MRGVSSSPKCAWKKTSGTFGNASLDPGSSTRRFSRGRSTASTAWFCPRRAPSWTYRGRADRGAVHQRSILVSALESYEMK